MPESIDGDEFSSLFVKDIPMLDVRSPMEFFRGAFPNATNIPLLDDKQREAVGRTYSQYGQQPAVELGQSLLEGNPKQQLLNQWQHYLEKNPDAVVYCFRGGLRSHTVRDWLAERDRQIPLVNGGFKALRQHLLTIMETTLTTCEFIVIAGKTGSAKTHLIEQLENSIDLEGLAQHRGSAFGRRVRSQPGQIDFENSLAIALLKLPYDNYRKLFVEDESRAIGSLSVPHRLHKKMSQSILAVIEEPMESRVDVILHDYIESNFREFFYLDEESAADKFQHYLITGLQRIRRRLGEQSYTKVEKQVQAALQTQLKHGDSSQHRIWINALLRDYYDPMYEYQLGKKLSRIVFRGNRVEFLDWSKTIASRKHG